MSPSHWFVAKADLASYAVALLLLVASPSAPVFGEEAGALEYPGLVLGRDWPWWRGPYRNGMVNTLTGNGLAGAELPIVWKSPIGGRGHASPIVVGDRIYLTTALEGDKSKEGIQAVLAFDRRTGQQVWRTDVNQGGLPEKIHRKNTHATPTLASDGQRLYVVFVHHDAVHLTAMTLAGEQQWTVTVGPFQPQRYEFGYAPSPVLYRELVIVSSEFDGDSAVRGLDRSTGKLVWRTPRPVNISYSTPMFAHVANQDQLFMSGGGQVCSYDPATGKQLWATAGTTAATCGTMVWDQDVVMASGGYPDPETTAVRADGSGTVLWKNKQKCYEQSMLAHNGYLYGLTDRGILFCWRIQDGHEMWKERLEGPVSASPVLVGDQIYWANEKGLCYVFRANPEKFDLITQHQWGEEAFASPAVVGGQFFIRTATGHDAERQEWLICAGQTSDTNK